MKDKETFYFSHDYNSREDEKVKELVFQYGMMGYGIYWALVEMLYQNANALRTNYARIAFDLHQSTHVNVQAIIEDFDLFSFNEDRSFFYSKSIQRRLEKRDEKSKKARESALNRWGKSDGNANASKTQSEPDAIKESKVKENKVKDNFLLEKETKGENQDFLQNQKSEDKELFESVNPETEKEKKVAPKKEKEIPPDLDTFIHQAREIYQNEIKIDFSPYEFAVRSKYQSWLDAGWKDGNKKPISNWKNKLRNTIPHLKPIYGTYNTRQSNSNSQGYSSGSNQFGKGGKITASQMVARAREEAITRHSESGN